MAETTSISWCDRTWSPWYGCTQVSMGERGACAGCYARQMHETRFHRVVFGGPGRGEGTRDVRAASAWKEPLRWDREAAEADRAWREAGAEWVGPQPSTFVFPSMCDPFDNHQDLEEPRRQFFDLIRATPNLTWLLLTKRPGNIVKLFEEVMGPAFGDDGEDAEWYLPDVWPANAAIGCTVVTQEEAERDVPKLLAAKAALNPAFAFLSMEPLLGPVDLRNLRKGDNLSLDALTGHWTGTTTFDGGFARVEIALTNLPTLPPILPPVDWVIAGGETDQGGHKARPSHPAWFVDLAGQCVDARVPFHFKQWGEWTLGENAHHVRGALTGAYVSDDGTWHETRFTERESQELHTDDAPDVWRVGKKAAGRRLEGQIYDARPEVRRG